MVGRPKASTPKPYFDLVPFAQQPLISWANTTFWFSTFVSLYFSLVRIYEGKEPVFRTYSNFGNVAKRTFGLA
jgi:hypothetical protein